MTTPDSEQTSRGAWGSRRHSSRAWKRVNAVAGWLAGQFMKGSGFGLLGDIIVGVIGAFIGGYLFRKVGVELGGGFIGRVIIAFAGALLLLFVIRLFTGRRAGGRLWS